jgi:predicted CopG family antitoxin
MYKGNTKTIRVSLDTYKNLEKLGTLADSFEEGVSDVYRIYTKRKGPKNIVRVEHQENPNQALADGYLVVPEGGSE